ncbi:His(2)-Cys(2) zinc finger-domain-containing protein, partial [Dipodascopsis tothii]|uniref:His(2)-Cys(2) zinc finger-domain-containing protein n=1 Tax=Dipodascopsis tothii TaxID=44089 RepID=UPI0034CD6332
MPAVLEDPTQPPHFNYAPVADAGGLVVAGDTIEPYTVLLRDGQTPATIYPITTPSAVPIELLAFLCDELNFEIEQGETYPMFEQLLLDTFQNYWFGSFAAVMLLGDAPDIMDNRDWSKECLGSFYVKPNYPGRAAHVCNAGFLVAHHARGKGIGRVLAECYIDWAPKLGYSYSVFNLVFETNIASRKIWESLDFKRVGRIKGAGILKNHDQPVDAIIYGRELVDAAAAPAGELSPASSSHSSSHGGAHGEVRFDRIKYYLETGRYPHHADRQEKSRLRSSAAHYRLRDDGRLMLKDREVVPEPERQLAIAQEVHLNGHVGINKTTATIAEKYHWTRIKETAVAAIRLCEECRETTQRPQTTRKMMVMPQHLP